MKSRHRGTGFVSAATAVALTSVCPSFGQPLANSVSGAVALPTPAKSRDNSRQALIVRVSVNGIERGDALVYESPDAIWIAESDIVSWQMSIPNNDHIVINAQKYYPALGLRLIELNLDRAAARLTLIAKAESFDTTRFDEFSVLYSPSPVVPLVMANYDLAATAGQRRSQAVAGVELVASNQWGAMTHQFIAQTKASEAFGVNRPYQRVATQFRHDWFEKNITLEAGDSVSRAGSLGRALRFGGIQIRTNFEMRPGYITQPYLSLGGDAVLPSTLQLFIDNQLRTTQTVPPGPFSLANIPVLGGAGDARLVVRDALGREQLIEQSFYATSKLLRTGLDDYAFALGKLRRDIDQRATYENAFASGLWRHGVSDNATVELRGASEQNRATDASASITVGSLAGELEAAGGLSHTSSGTFGTAALGYAYRAKNFSLSGRAEFAQRGFQYAGDLLLAPRWQAYVSSAYKLADRWALNASAIYSQKADNSTTRSFNASVSKQFEGYLTVQLGASRVINSLQGTNTTIYLGLSMPLSTGQIVSGTLSGGSSKRYAATVETSEPQDTGWRYRAGYEHEGDADRLRGEVNWYLPRVKLGAQVATTARGETNVRLASEGAFGWVDGKVFASRPVFGSLALVDVSGFAALRRLAQGR